MCHQTLRPGDKKGKPPRPNGLSRGVVCAERYLE